MDTEEVLNALKTTYNPDNFNRPDVYRVAMKWLKSLGEEDFGDASVWRSVQSWLTSEGF